MELISALSAAFLFALACNLDTVLLAMGFTAKGSSIPPGGALVIALITTVVTWLSLVLGDMTAALFSPKLSTLLGGIILVGIGLWMLLDYLRRLGGQEETVSPNPPSLRGCVSLAAALAVNNAGVGAAAGVAGIGPVAATVCNFLITLAALPLGRWLGIRVAGRVLGKYALPLSGVLLVVLGVWGALF